MYKKLMKMIIFKGFKTPIRRKDFQFQVNPPLQIKNNLINFKNHLNTSAKFSLEFSKLKKMKVNLYLKRSKLILRV